MGATTYANHDLDLRFVAKDAESMAAAGRLGANRLFGHENVSLRVLSTAATSEGDQPTKKNIALAFEHVRRTATPDDVLFAYFSGHGVSSRRERDFYYYLTAGGRTLDIDSENDQKLRDISTVSSKELLEWLREPAKTMPLSRCSSWTPAPPARPKRS